VVVFAHQLKRVEGPSGVLAQTQMLAGAMVVILIVIPTMLWTAAAYRPERNPDIVLALNDIGWFFLHPGVLAAGGARCGHRLAVLGAPDEDRVPALGRLPSTSAGHPAGARRHPSPRQARPFAWKRPDRLVAGPSVDFGIFWTVNSIVLFRAIAQEAAA